jgi:hypothetical protein
MASSPAEGVLPWTAPLDVSGLGADRSDPVLHCLGDGLELYCSGKVASVRLKSILDTDELLLLESIWVIDQHRGLNQFISKKPHSRHATPSTARRAGEH